MNKQYPIVGSSAKEGLRLLEILDINLPQEEKEAFKEGWEWQYYMQGKDFIRTVQVLYSRSPIYAGLFVGEEGLKLAKFRESYFERLIKDNFMPRQ